MRRKCNKFPKLHIKRGDIVKVLCGDPEIRGKKGMVLSVNPVKQTAIVEDTRFGTKFFKRTQENPKGMMAEIPMPIHISNLQLIDPKSGKPTRVGRQKTDKGWVRISKKTGQVIQDK